MIYMSLMVIEWSRLKSWNCICWMIRCRYLWWMIQIGMKQYTYVPMYIINMIIHISSSKLPKFRKCTYTMNPSYSRPVSLDPLFSQPVSLCVTCFTPVKWLVAMGRPLQLNLEIVWHHVDALCCSWNAMEPGWAKACPDKWVSHFGDWRRRGFQNIVWLVCWVGWNPVKLQQPASARSVEFGKLWPRILLSGDFRPRILMSHRTRGVSSHHRGPHRTPHTYSQIIVLHKRDRTPEKLAQTAKNMFFKKLTWRVVFIFSSSEVKCSGIW